MPNHSLTRRHFIQSSVAASAAAPFIEAATQADRPNLLWLVWEDIGPHLGCCGDSYSVTPNFDRLAKRGCVYDNCWASAPVCAPARTAIISGVCPTATGAEHMRSMARMPAGWKMFPGYLRDAGYYCVNNGKEDYNLEKPEGTWDTSWELGAANANNTRRTAPTPAPATIARTGIPPLDPANGHWRARKPGQPFFAFFNDMATHESQIFRSATNKNLQHDPAQAWLAGFQPDTPEIVEIGRNITTNSRPLTHAIRCGSTSWSRTAY